MRRAWLVLWVGAGVPLMALRVDAADDLLHSAPCRQALQALTAAEADTGASMPLRAARQQAATACLGPAAGPSASAPRAAAAAPTPVPGVGRLAPLPTAPARADTAPRPLPRPPVTVGACDAAGCWASDGSRLQKQGSVLVGPRGVCTQTAGVLNCP